MSAPDRDDRSYLANRSIKRQLLEELNEPPGPTRGDLADMLGRWPTEPQEDSDVAGLLFQDFRQRSLRGEQLSRTEYEQQYPEHQDSLGSLFRRQDFLRSVTSATDPQAPLLALPSIGDELFGFRLRSQLGQGAFARVFLAEQSALAGRPVALKTSDLTGTEPQTLAQLQHTHIVPIYSVHEDQAAGIRAVCMPYFGGAALSQVLRTVWERNNLPTTGTELVAALVESSGPPIASPQSVIDATVIVPVDAEGQEAEVRDQKSAPEFPHRPCVGGEMPSPAPLAKLESLNYVEACAWIVARLAEGMQHAHDRGVLHRDIKPSNILIGGDGTPMLLDFNLAHDESQPQAQVEATLGGTVAYMAPEHLRAMNMRSRELINMVDHRADIYGLGMVLFEMITGHNPFDQQASYSPMPILLEAMAAERSRSVPSLRAFRDDAPWGLESIVRKCLDPDVSRRYQQSSQLTEDLDRLLDNRPLKYAPELSRVEQVRKWVRRHPKLASSALVATVAAGLLTLGAMILTSTQARLAASQTRAYEAEGAEARQLMQKFERGTLQALCLVNTHSDVKQHTAEGRTVCEKTLALFGILDNSNWQAHSAWQRLNVAEQAKLAEDARELLLLLAGANVRLAEEANAEQVSGTALAAGFSQGNIDSKTPVASAIPLTASNGGLLTPPRSPILSEALALLDRAHAIHDLPPSAAVWQAKATILRKLGETDAATEADQQASRILPSSARDFYLLATAHLQNGAADRHAAAIKELQQAVRIDPRHYWSWMQKGLCHLELGEHHQALADFGVCIGLWPEFAWGYFNRGFTLDQAGQKSAAITDYSAALERDPELIAAYQNRGMAYFELGQHVAALADFDRLIELGRNESVLLALRGQALEGLQRPADADAAFASAFANVSSLPEPIRHQLFCSYGFAVCSRLPAEAQKAFRKIPSDDPKYPEALYGLGLLAANQSRTEQAVELFGKALERRPAFEEARRFRAVLLARLERFTEAITEINIALQAAPKSGAARYAAACVTALGAEQAASPAFAKQAADEAIHFLRQAREQGYGQNAETDPDLAAIRNHPEFERLMRTR